MAKKTEDHKTLSVEEAIKELGSDKDKGLSGDEVLKRLDEYGYNEIPEEEESALHRILRRYSFCQYVRLEIEHTQRIVNDRVTSRRRSVQ